MSLRHSADRRLCSSRHLCGSYPQRRKTRPDRPVGAAYETPNSSLISRTTKTLGLQNLADAVLRAADDVIE